MKTEVYRIILSICFLAELNAGILSEDLTRFRMLNLTERSVLEEPRTKIDILKRICYIETHLFYRQTPEKDTNDKLLREVADNFQAYWECSFTDLLWQIPVVDRGGIFVVEGHRPKTLVIFWIIRKRIDSAFDDLTVIMRSNMSNFLSYYKTILSIANKALKNLTEVDTEPVYSELSDEEKLKEAYRRLDGEKGFFDYPRRIVQLLK